MKAVSAFTKIAILIALIAFVFPFVSVSCMGKTVEATGLDLIVGKPADDMYLEYDSDEAVEPNVCLILAFISGVAAFVLSFKDDMKVRASIGAALCFGSSLMLFIFKSNLYEMILSASMKSRITEYMFWNMAKMEWGWKLSLAAFIFGALGMLVTVFLGESVSRQAMSDTAKCPFCGSVIPAKARSCPVCDGPLKLDCPFCGTENPITVDFCTACGMEFPQTGDDETGSADNETGTADNEIESADNAAESANDAAEAAGEETEAKEVE